MGGIRRNETSCKGSCGEEEAAGEGKSVEGVSEQ